MFRRLLFIVIIINIHTSLCSLELYETGRQVWKLYTMIDNRGLNISHDAEATEHLSNDSTIQEFKKQMNTIHESLHDLEKFMAPKNIKNTIESWQLNALIIRDIDMIEIFVTHIDRLYEKFNGYMNESYRSNISFKVLRNQIFRNLPAGIDGIRKFTYKEKHSLHDEDVVAAIAGFARAHDAKLCGTPQIISNMLMQLFKMIIIAELKASTMLAYQNMYVCVKNEDKQECQRKNSLARQMLEEQLGIYINIFSLNVAVTDVIYQRACDPPVGSWTRGDSFYELERNVQPVLFDYNSDRCVFDSCYDIMYGDFNRCEVTFYNAPSVPRQENSIDGCSSLGGIEACLLNSGPNRYLYVKSTILDFCGRNSPCLKDNGQIIKTRSTLMDTYRTCECNIWSSENKVSLAMVESHLLFNRVITGLRFVRKNKVLYIQIREGELKSNGYINEFSQSWMDISENQAFSAPINKDNRVFFLDVLILPSGSVLTGVKFNQVKREGVTGFSLSILGRPFDYKTGVLSDNGWQWQEGSNEKSGEPLSFISVSSIFTTLTHEVTSSNKKYVLLKPSRLNEDIGQSTLPLFDAVPIEFSVPSALTGVGIFHKGVEGYAGFISLRVYGIQYLEYLNDFKLSHVFNDKVLFNSSGEFH